MNIYIIKYKVLIYEKKLFYIKCISTKHLEKEITEIKEQKKFFIFFSHSKKMLLYTEIYIYEVKYL